MTAELLDVLQAVGHLEVGGLRQKEAGYGPQHAEEADDQKGGLLRYDGLNNNIIFESPRLSVVFTEYTM